MAWWFIAVAASALAQTPVPSQLATPALTELALNQPGDPVRGKLVFNDETRAACTKCHSTDGRTAKAGPNLAAIGDKFPRRELIRSVLEPSSSIAVGYGTTVIETRDGEEFQGVIKQATESWIELTGGDGKPVRVAIPDIKEQRTTDLSLMPEGLAGGLRPQEFVDLIAYLESLHQPVTASAQTPGMPELIPQASREVRFQPFFGPETRFNRPLWFGGVPGFTNRFVVLEHGGRSWIIDRTPAGDQQSSLLDLSDSVRVGGATGLLGLAFHPRFLENRKYYLKYQVISGGRLVTRLVERQFTADFQHDAGTPPRLLLEIGTVTQDHNGGSIGFGPDGFLYVGMGDSGPQGDPQGHGQDLGLLWGKILRIDVDQAENGLPYGIPRDNPFVTRTGMRPEIWAYGFREPWRFSFDPATGDLWVGDVGQDRVEEVSLVRKGENLGWNVYEGHTAFSEQYRRSGEHYVPPVFSYWHRTGVSVTGGFVYRGRRAPALAGRYICGDFEARRVWALTQTNRQLDRIVEIGRAPSRLVSFGRDHDGELYVVGYDSGIVYRMDLATVDLTPRESQIIASTAEAAPVLWRFSLEAPTNDWFHADFDDSQWRLAPAGFGTTGTPGAVVRTEWRTSDIWIRRAFSFANHPATGGLRTLALRLHHDEDAEVYLNGVELAHTPHWTSGYVDLPLTGAASAALRDGRNILAIHCHQNSGGQYIDAGLVEYREPPRQ